MNQSFWKQAAASLPREVREQYAKEFETMERYEALIDGIARAGHSLRRALGQGCRAGARLLDRAAQRLSPLPSA